MLLCGRTCNELTTPPFSPGLKLLLSQSGLRPSQGPQPHVTIRHSQRAKPASPQKPALLTPLGLPRWHGQQLVVTGSHAWELTFGLREYLPQPPHAIVLAMLLGVCQNVGSRNATTWTCSFKCETSFGRSTRSWQSRFIS